eukprot:2701485-Amphidinium_carterae.1
MVSLVTFWCRSKGRLPKDGGHSSSVVFFTSASSSGAFGVLLWAHERWSCWASASSTSGSHCVFGAWTDVPPATIDLVYHRTPQSRWLS